MNKVTVVSLDKKRNIRARYKAEAEIRLAALKILKKLKKDGVFLEVYLADSRKIRFLNRKFRGKNKPADILSFKEPKNFPHPEMKMRHIGEVYLNTEVSSFKSSRHLFKKNLEGGILPTAGQVSSLLAHGILHLFGYGHKRKIDRIKMEKAEKRLI